MQRSKIYYLKLKKIPSHVTKGVRIRIPLKELILKESPFLQVLTSLIILLENLNSFKLKYV